jgi:hypothetical protein
MRFLSAIVITLVLATPALAQTYDEGVEKVAIDTIKRFVSAIKSIRAVCDAGADGCDKEKLAEHEADLREAIEGANNSAISLGVEYSQENDPARAAVLAGRRDALLVARQLGSKILGDAPKPDPNALEQTLAAEIRRVVPLIVAMDDKCNAEEPSCDLATLARDRFALRDLMARAIEIDNKILEEYAKAKEEEAPKLAARHHRLLAALEPARKISFVVHEDRTLADELVDRLKALDEQVEHLEKEHARATKAANAARKTEKAEAGKTEKAQAGKTENAQAGKSEKEGGSEAEAKPPAPTAAELKAQAAELKAQAADARTRLANLESVARAQGVSDRQAIARIDDDLKSGREEVQFTKQIERRKLLRKRLGEIESMVTLPANDNPLYRVYDDDYEDWWIHQFYMGGEFDSVSGIFNKGFARVGYTSWWHTGGEHIPELRPRSGFGNYGRHYIFNALLTSTGEQNLQTLIKPTSADDPCAANAPSTADCSRRALEVEQKFFWSAYRTPRHNRIRMYAGPVASVGASFVDPTEHDDARLAAYRYYGGMHFGFARDAWSELLFGRSSTLGTKRLEVRGEIPVAKWGAKSRVLLGWAANFRAGGDPKFIRTPQREIQAVDRDVFRVYVQYELDFLALTGLQPPKP